MFQHISNPWLTRWSLSQPTWKKGSFPLLSAYHDLISRSGTGACLEYLLKNGTVFLINPGSPVYDLLLDVLGTLVKLSESDRPFGIQAEVLRSVQNMVILLDEQFLVHSAVHKAVLRLLRNCVGDDMQEQLDGRDKVMGAAGNAIKGSPSEYEEDRAFFL